MFSPRCHHLSTSPKEYDMFWYTVLAESGETVAANTKKDNFTFSEVAF